jgi:hypothetical protein
MENPRMIGIAQWRARAARAESGHEALVEQALQAAQGPAAAHVFTRLHAPAARPRRATPTPWPAPACPQARWPACR